MYHGGMPEVFQGVRGGLAEAKVMCNGANMLSLCVVHEGEIVFLCYYHSTLSENVVTQVYKFIFSKDLQFFQVRYFPSKLFVSDDEFASFQRLVPNKKTSSSPTPSIPGSSAPCVDQEVRSARPHRGPLALAGNVMSQKDEITKFFDRVDMEQSRKFVKKLSDKGSSNR